MVPLSVGKPLSIGKLNARARGSQERVFSKLPQYDRPGDSRKPPNHGADPRLTAVGKLS